MNMLRWTPVLLFLWLPSLSPLSYAAPRSPAPSPRTRSTITVVQIDAPAVQIVQVETDLDTFSPEEPIKTIADPFEPVNRVFFVFNDRLYFWVLKPIALGYNAVIPPAGRIGVRNFFSNLATPIRLGNCLLQFKFRGAGIEVIRFVVNTSIGFLGLVDIAKKEFDLRKQEEDFGQTLGFYGIGPVFYIDWPLLGPSSLRDTAGFVGDRFLDPWVRIVDSVLGWAAVAAYNRMNQASLTIGEYEALKEAALDPYVALRDAYHQFRQSKIKE